jgi:hypothetical protein
VIDEVDDRRDGQGEADQGEYDAVSSCANQLLACNGIQFGIGGEGACQVVS